ncbi:MAG: D-glycero-beta-D-manno-heptose-7-phosphate kinase [Gemmatimonadetes bacterium]|nr:D-glycero-beta-D-manno-heptose-7-phosphate kinase [Gemmatimonadota bacterium]MCB9517366.1 D-glycero-beta-D-manno-heptose-7-phosphate kinase [Gemmatimonadales bacterium]MCA9762126.1 D-glycero-beta-D-manno-heptose-7-phosphate kinase [Gemmatimonadota bacterium]MCA9767600.1 D-glycero-beta-D-manno-heptose-7-phosphate kinase [Gemmatimonadota bacterium]HPF62066.1 bifunctional ADP-heptose synthase [Gemmatimonadales bacterium]
MTDALHSVPYDRITHLLERMGEVRVAIVGDLMLDRYLLGDVDRISPEAPVPVLTVEEERDSPGGAANVAANAASLGATVELVGVVGDDDAGATLRELLRGYETGTTGVIEVGGRPTTTKTRIIARGQQVVRIDREVDNPLADRTRDAVMEAAQRAIAECDVLLLEDYDKGVFDLPMLAGLIEAARARGVPIIADPKERHFFGFAGATVFKPNRREIERAFGSRLPTDAAMLIEARRRLDVENLLLTLGADGFLLVVDGDVVRQSPSIAREVYDVSGAGDTVTAWTGVALAAGATVEEAAWLANLAAGVQVGKQGTATVSHDELLDAWDAIAGE